MGKQRNSDMLKINALESEMREYGRTKRTGLADKDFVIHKKAKLQLSSMARRQGVPIEKVRVKVRGAMKQMVDSKLFTWTDQTLH